MQNAVLAAWHALESFGCLKGLRLVWPQLSVSGADLEPAPNALCLQARSVIVASITSEKQHACDLELQPSNKCTVQHTRLSADALGPSDWRRCTA